jgi:hypothetical protein
MMTALILTERIKFMTQETHSDLIGMLREAVDAIQEATPAALETAATILWFDALHTVIVGGCVLAVMVAVLFGAYRWGKSIYRADADDVHPVIIIPIVTGAFLGPVSLIVFADIASLKTFLGLFAPDLALAYRAMQAAGLL